MTATRQLSVDELLTTTRAVRRRLEFDRPVPAALIRECLALAVQAPSMSNLQPWHFMVVTDPEKRQALAEIYRRAFAIYRDTPSAASKIVSGEPVRDAVQQRVMSSAEYLAEHLHRVPVLVVPCVESDPAYAQNWMASASVMGSVIPAAWSFCLAARARGLGTSWTTLHLMFEEESAELLGIPFETVRQVALIPVGYTIGGAFRPAHRAPLDDVVHIDSFTPVRATLPIAATSGIAGGPTGGG